MHPTFAWFRWPDRPTWRAFWGYGALLVVQWVVVYGGADWIASLHHYRVPLYLDVEIGWPFVPAAVFVYLSLFPMLWLAPFILQTPSRVRAFATTLAWLIALSGVGFLLFPSESVYPTPTESGTIGKVIRFADWINLDHNFLPSLHVSIAAACAAIYCRFLSRTEACITWIWATSIAVSTLLLHQHYILDVIAGGLLALLVIDFQRAVFSLTR